MTPLELLAFRSVPLRLVIFDCDGVLVDSEPPTNRLVARELTQLGWAMTAEEAQRIFLGMNLESMVPVIESRLGIVLPEDWTDTLLQRLLKILAEESTAIPGAVETLRALSAAGIPWRVASNSSHAEMEIKFARIGISDLTEGRLHSHHDVPRGKPAPDLFLAAAAAEDAAPLACLVVEDSVPGVRAAAAAGMDCLGYAGHTDGAALRNAGAVLFRSMFELPALIEAAWRTPA